MRTTQSFKILWRGLDNYHYCGPKFLALFHNTSYTSNILEHDIGKCIGLYLSVYLSTYLSVYLSICLYIYMYVKLYIHLSIHPYDYSCIYIDIQIHICIYTSLSVYVYLFFIYIRICSYMYIHTEYDIGYDMSLQEQKRWLDALSYPRRVGLEFAQDAAFDPTCSCFGTGHESFRESSESLRAIMFTHLYTCLHIYRCM